VTYKWDYSPTLDSWVLIGPWTAPDNRSARAFHQYGRVNRAAGGVCWAVHGSGDKMPVKFYDADEAKAYVLALVRLS
jgi:hypothetical protein